MHIQNNQSDIEKVTRNDIDMDLLVIYRQKLCDKRFQNILNNINHPFNTLIPDRYSSSYNLRHRRT